MAVAKYSDVCPLFPCSTPTYYNNFERPCRCCYGQGMATLLMLVIVKIAFDLVAHLAEHSKVGNFAAPSVD